MDRLKSVMAFAVLGTAPFVLNCSGDSETAACTLGTTWATLYSNDTTVSTGNAIPLIPGVLMNSTTGFWLAGATGATTKVWDVHGSTDSGTTFASKDLYSLASGKSSQAYQIFEPTSGSLYVVGSAQDSSDKNHWTVRRSLDGGTTWSTGDDYQRESGFHSVAYGGGNDPSNNLFAIGYTAYTGAVAWVTRKSTNGGSSWTNVDDFTHISGGETEGVSIAFDSTGVIYAAGVGYNAARSISTWLVRKSSDGGTTWTTVDEYQKDATTKNNPQRIMVDSSNNIFVVGNIGADNATDWLIRKSADGGTSWTNVADYKPSGATSATGYGIEQAADGSYYSSGWSLTSSVTSWLVRTSTDGTTWTDSESFQLTTDTNSIALGLAKDSSNNLYATGVGTNSSSTYNWMIRKLTCTAASSAEL